MQQSPAVGAGRKGASSSTHESTVPIILPWPFLRCFPAQLRSPAKPCPRVQQQVCQCGDKCGEREGRSEEAGREEKRGAAAPGPFTGTRKWGLKHRGVAVTVSRPSAETVARNGKCSWETVREGGRGSQVLRKERREERKSGGATGARSPRQAAGTPAAVGRPRRAGAPFPPAAVPLGWTEGWRTGLQGDS